MSLARRPDFAPWQCCPQSTQTVVDNFLAGQVVVSTPFRYLGSMKENKTFTHNEVIALLMSDSPKTQAVRLVLEMLGEATTAQVAKALTADPANTGRRLEALAEDGVAEMVDDCHTVPGKPGRPSRVWALTK